MSGRGRTEPGGRRRPAAAGAAALLLALSCSPGPAAPVTDIRPEPWAWLADEGALMLVTSIPEARAYRTHGRVELSLAEEPGREVFRAMYNASQRANPVPPEAFGVLDPADGSFESAGIEAEWEVARNGFALTPDSVSVRRDGRLAVNWVIRLPGSLDTPIAVRARVLPRGRDEAPWVPLGEIERRNGGWRFAERPPDRAAAATAEPMSGDRAAEVLRGLERMWSRGEDPERIAALRRRAVAAIGAAGGYTVGSRTYPLTELRRTWEWMAAKPDVLVYRVASTAELAPRRLLVVAVAAGRPHDTPAPANATRVLPKIDVAAAVGHADPWVVSGALFLARKQRVELDPAALLARWRAPLPWDDVCTEQALLYLARRPVARDDGAGDVPSELAALEAAAPGRTEILPWAFLASGAWSPEIRRIEPTTGVTLETLDSTMEPISRRPASLDGGALDLPATSNYYRLRYLEGAMQGGSLFIEGRAGTFVRLAVPVEGGV